MYTHKSVSLYIYIHVRIHIYIYISVYLSIPKTLSEGLKAEAAEAPKSLLRGPRIRHGAHLERFPQLLRIWGFRVWGQALGCKFKVWGLGSGA